MSSFPIVGSGAPVIYGALCLCKLAHLQWSYQISAESRTCVDNVSCEAESIQLDLRKPADLVELAAINIFIWAWKWMRRNKSRNKCNKGLKLCNFIAY